MVTVYQVICQEKENIEIGLDGDLTVDEFKQVIHQLESLCTAHPRINVLFDATHLEKYEFKIALEEYDFYKKYKNYLGRVAVVSDRPFFTFMTKLFGKFIDAEYEHFSSDDIEKAREWIFVPRLP